MRITSPVNWIQLGRLILVPQYERTLATDTTMIDEMLSHEGFEVDFIDSPTARFCGSLHCMTASIYA